MSFKWVCLVGEVRGGHLYAAGEVWNGEGPSPMGSPSWTPVGMASDKPPAAPAPDPEPVNPHEPPPIPDWSSDESAQATRAAFAAWRARGNR
jgi:hypothetical protein